MTITINSSIEQECSKNKEQYLIDNPNCPELQEVFKTVLKDKNEYDEKNLNWIDEKNVEVKKVSPMALHNFVLKAEEMGKGVVYEQKTIIRITD